MVAVDSVSAGEFTALGILLQRCAPSIVCPLNVGRGCRNNSQEVPPRFLRWVSARIDLIAVWIGPAEQSSDVSWRVAANRAYLAC